MKTLKKILFISLLILCSNLIYSQGFNLEFSQPILKEISGTTTGPSGWKLVSTTTFTVPASKIWKIESGGTTFLDGLASINNANLLINSNVIYYGGPYTPNSFPIWLQAGTYNFKLTSDVSSGVLINGFISGVEYNLVP